MKIRMPRLGLGRAPKTEEKAMGAPVFHPVSSRTCARELTTNKIFRRDRRARLSGEGEAQNGNSSLGGG